MRVRGVKKSFDEMGKVEQCSDKMKIVELRTSSMTYEAR